MKNKSGGDINAILACMLIAIACRSDSRSITAERQHIMCAGMHTGMTQPLISHKGPDREWQILLNTTVPNGDRQTIGAYKPAG